MLLTVTDIRSEGNVRLDEPETNGLVTSMKAIGQVTPITVRETEGEVPYVVIAGHRRLAAAVELGWEQIEAYVIDSSGAPLALQIAENVSRKDLTDYELAQGVLALQVESKMTQAEIADALGIDKKQVSIYQKIGKGTAGLEPGRMNQLGWHELEIYSEIHDMPPEMRDRFTEQVDGSHEYWVVNEYVAEVHKWRWSKKKENKALIKAMEDAGAIPMQREETHSAKRLHGAEIERHRIEPCHGYWLASTWYGDGKDYEIHEYCLDPRNHADSEDELLKGMAKDSVRHDKAGTVAQRSIDKARRERKTARKQAVLNFSGKPRMKDLAAMMRLCILDMQPQYRWQELGKTFGLAKEKDEFHFDWSQYLEDFNAKDRLTQELVLAIGSWYLSLDSTYSSSKDAVLEEMDRLFVAVFEVTDETTTLDGGEEE